MQAIDLGPCLGVPGERVVPIATACHLLDSYYAATACITGCNTVVNGCNRWPLEASTLEDGCWPACSMIKELLSSAELLALTCNNEGKSQEMKDSIAEITTTAQTALYKIHQWNLSLAAFCNTLVVHI